MARRQCDCGSDSQLVRMQLTRSYRCPVCGAERVFEESYDVPAEDLGAGLSETQIVSRLVLDDRTLEMPEAPGEARREEETPAPARSERAVEARPPAGIGERHLDSYRLLSKIGQGGMGVVYRAHDCELDREVAVKLLNEGLNRNPAFIERFKREARAAARVSHPNVTHIYAIGEHGGQNYFVMELVEGTSLEALIAREGPLDPSRALDLATQVARGLEAAFQKTGIVHRDIKPSNLLLDRDGIVKITDFGLAKAIAGSVAELTQSGTVLGTPLYMSPEQGRGETSDHRADIYSLGATLYHMIFGQPPFSADTPLAIILKHLNQSPRFDPKAGAEPAPPHVVSILRRMLAKDPGQRYGEYADLLEDFEKAREGAVPRAAAEEASQIFYVDVKATGQSSDGGRMAHSKLAIADANLRMGRVQKAQRLLEDVLENVPTLRVAAALRLLPLYEGNEDGERARQMAELIAEETEDPLARAVARWHLGTFLESDALRRSEEALECYRAAAADDGPLPRDLVRAKIDELAGRIEASRSALEDSKVRLRST